MRVKFWKKKRVLVTGGHGFLGHHLLPLIRETNAVVEAPDRKKFDLRIPRDVDKLFLKFSPDIVIHMAAHGGGIGHMKAQPGSIFYDNIMMDTLIVEASRKYTIEKFVGIGTVCSYPKFTPVPFCEDDLWNGFPEDTNAPYGLAKKMMLVQTQAYRRQFGLNGIHLLLTNMYGPYDHFDTRVSHVIPALISKFVKAVNTNAKKVIAWGSGRVSREFLYAGDAARAILLATEKYNSSEPINVGSGQEIVIRDLAMLLAQLVGFKGKICWESSYPDGQPKRRLDTSKARRFFGFRPKVSLKKGLKETLQWYYSSLGR